jgi:DNA gyrase subunit A
MNLKSILTDYIDFQIDIIYKRSLFDLKAKEKEKHILDGFIVVINDIDRVVDLFKKAKDTKEALDKLKNIYDFSEEQLKSISGMRLQSLVILEKTKLEIRLNILKQEIFELNEVISKKEKRVEILVKQLKAIKETYGDQRRTLILNEEEKISESDLFKKEDIVITLSNRDYIKRMPLISYRLQNRGGIGSKALNFSEGDNLKKILVTSTHCDLLFFTNLGRVYRLKAYQVPDYSKQAKGLPILNLIGISPLEKVNIILTIDDYQKEKYLLFFTKLGFVKKTLLKDFISVQKKGKIAIKLRDNDEVINCFVVGSNTNVVIASNTANLVHFNTKQLRPLSRSSIGVKGINLKKDSYVIASCYSDDLNSSLLTISEKGIGKLTLLKDYRLTKRGTKGVKAFKVSNKTGLMAAVKIIDSLDDEILIYTNDGSTIRLDVKKIRHYKRYTQGVKLISLKKASQKIVAVEIVKTNKEIDDKN